VSVLRAVCSVAIVAVVVMGCVVEERTVVRPARPCAGGVWIVGHYGPRGHWHHGHWRCPDIVEVVEVD
jgi:hypothetical protein